MTDLPRKAVTRTAKLATLPLGFAGRTALGLGKRVGGKSAEVVAAEVQARTAEQLFRVLGELKGGAMKFGQALSIFEHLAERNGVRATARLVKVNRNTVVRYSRLAGGHARQLHDELVAFSPEHP